MERRRQIIATPVQQRDKDSEVLASRPTIEKLRAQTATQPSLTPGDTRLLPLLNMPFRRGESLCMHSVHKYVQELVHCLSNAPGAMCMKQEHLLQKRLVLAGACSHQGFHRPSSVSIRAVQPQAHFWPCAQMLLLPAAISLSSLHTARQGCAC